MSIQRRMEHTYSFYHKIDESSSRSRRSDGSAIPSMDDLPLWHRGLVRCIIEMAMRLVKGVRIALVVPSGELGSSTQATYEDYRKWAARSRDKQLFDRCGKQYLALWGKVHANGNGSDIVNGAKNDSEAIQLILGNDGISIELDAQRDRPSTEKAFYTEVSWLNIIHGDFEIWQYNQIWSPMPNYISALGEKKRVLCNSAPIIQRLFF